MRNIFKNYPYKEVFLVMIGFALGIIVFNIDMERLIKVNNEYKTIYSNTVLKIDAN